MRIMHGCSRGLCCSCRLSLVAFVTLLTCVVSLKTCILTVNILVLALGCAGSTWHSGVPYATGVSHGQLSIGTSINQH